MNLSARLTNICQAIQPYHYDHIWDCCCDHGCLGQRIMAEHPSSQVHFVDVVQHLIDEIEIRLASVPQKNGLAQCSDVAMINLHEGKDHLVIIAGVGGDLLLEMVRSIVSRHSSLMKTNRLDFILCPVRQLHKVRQGLNDLKLGLISEKIVQDNKLFYEIIQVSNQSPVSISLVGETMWDLSLDDHRSYRDTMMAHYQKQPSDDAKQLLALYKHIQ